MKLYDTLTKAIKQLEFNGNEFKIYACGPTVYDVPHLGHARQVLIHDILRRHLENSGVEVKFVSNITDVDDKIIKRAVKENTTFKEVAVKYEKTWNEMLSDLNVKEPDHAPHATDYISDMVNKIMKMVESGNAYVGETGVWFNVSSIQGFNSLSAQNETERLSGARISVVSDKHNPEDFALWKFTDAPGWDSPWGFGRPGWHTECVSMSLSLFGESMDLHAGGLDLMFPHHDNERLQAAALNATFAGHWMHHAFVEMNGSKMGKSEGNAINLNDVLKDHDARVLRLIVLMSHYRSPLNVTPSGINAASNTLKNLDSLYASLPKDGFRDEKIYQATLNHLNDDLDTVRFTSELFNISRVLKSQIAEGQVDSSLAKTFIELWAHVGFIFKEETRIPAEVSALVKRREAARGAKNWALSDELRDHARSLGWILKDTPSGTVITEL